MRILLEPSPGRMKCVVCREAIGKGVLQIREETYNDYTEKTRRACAHLPCALEMKWQLAHDALLSKDTEPALAETVLPQLDDKLAELVRTRLARVERSKALHAPITVGKLGDDPVLTELLDRPDDRGLLEVLADILQQRGDSRGELIALQLALADATPPHDLALLGRRDELITAFSPPARNWMRKPAWGIGFVRRLDLMVDEEVEADEAARPVLAHDSSRFVTDLVVAPIADPPLAGMLPPSIRRLTISGWTKKLPAIVTALPRLQGLAIDRKAAVLEVADIKLIETALRGRRLAKLELTGQLPPTTAERLAPLADVVELNDRSPPGQSSGTVWVEHANKPEWGRGKLVRELEGKLEIDFPNGGVRILKADLPFLKIIR